MIQLSKQERKANISEDEVEECGICKEVFGLDDPAIFITSGEFTNDVRHVDWYSSCMISQGIRPSTPFIASFVHIKCLLDKVPELKEE